MLFDPGYQALEEVASNTNSVVCVNTYCFFPLDALSHPQTSLLRVEEV